MYWNMFFMYGSIVLGYLGAYKSNKARLSHGASKILVDSSLPANPLFELLSSSRRYRAIKAKTRQFRLGFFPEAIWVMQPFSSVV